MLQGNPNEQGYRFQTLSLTQPVVTLTANGQWQQVDGKDVTGFDVQLKATKFDELSNILGINLGIQDAPLDILASLSWNDVPYRFNLAGLNGHLKFDLGKGHLSELSDKGARLFSLFSLDSILRKLSLDFSDVFGQGLYFNSFAGNLDIDDGVVKTTDTEMDGIAGAMKVRGFTDLTTRSLNYDIRFSPQLASSVPTVVLLSTSAWTLGVGAFALTKVLEPVIEVISEIRFRLTGDMENPVLEELERKSKEIEIPESILRDSKQTGADAAVSTGDAVNTDDAITKGGDQANAAGDVTITESLTETATETVEQKQGMQQSPSEEPAELDTPNQKPGPAPDPNSQKAELEKVAPEKAAPEKAVPEKVEQQDESQPASQADGFIRESTNQAEQGEGQNQVSLMLIHRQGASHAMELTAMSEQQRCSSQPQLYRIAA
nr:AsmA-like C-terminal region-containing protein [Shewanella maritima]